MTALLVVPTGAIAMQAVPDPVKQANDELAALLADYRFEPADVEAALAVSDGDLLGAISQLASPALYGALASTWYSGDAESIRALLRSAFDADAGRFNGFDTEYPAFDETLARLYVEGFMEARFIQESASAAANEALLSLLTTGKLPPGYEWADDPAADGASGEAPVAPASNPEPEAEAEPPAAEDIGTVPPNPLAAGPAGDGGLDNSPSTDTQSFFITSCSGCDVAMTGSSGAITATFDLGDIDPLLIEEAQISVSAFDIDWFVAFPCGTPIEVDMVYLNGNVVDHLVGANEQWSVSEMNVNPAHFVPGTNTISIYIDTAGNGCWAATVDWIQVDVNAPKGDVRVRSVETDKDGYNLGEQVTIKATVYTTEEAEPDPYPAKVQFNLYDPTGAIPTQTTKSVSIPKGQDVEIETTLTIPQSVQVGSVDPGTWTVAAIAIDKEGKRSDSGSKEIGVGTNLKISKDDIEIKQKGTNARGTLAKLDVTASFLVSSAVDEAQSFDVVIQALQEGAVVSEKTESFSVTGPVSGQRETARTVEFQLDLKKTPTIRVILDKSSKVREISEGDNQAEKKLSEPEVVKIDSRFFGNFLESLRVDNHYTAEVKDPELGEPVTKVRWTLEDEFGRKVNEWEVSSRGNGFKLDLEMGSIDPGIYKLKAVAITGDGIESKPKDVEITIWSKPFLLLSMAAFPGFTLFAQITGNKIEYLGGMEIKFFTPKFRSPGGVLEAALCGGGGGDDSTNAKFTLKIDHKVLSTSASWTLGVGGEWEFKIAGKGAKGGVGGSGTWTPGDPSWTWDLRKVAVSYSLVFSFSCDVLGFIVNKFPVVGWIADYLLSLNLNADVGLVDGGIELTEDGRPQIVDGIGFNKVDGTVGVSLSAGPVIGPSWANIGFSVGGGIGVTLGVDQAGFGLKKIAGCLGGCKFKLTGSFIWVSGTILDATLIDEFNFYGGALQSYAFETLPRDYVVDGYSTFAGGAGGLLVSGAAPFAKPALAANAAGAVAAAWTTDDAARARPGSTDVLVAIDAGAGFGAPVAVAATDAVEFSPIVAVAEDGRALAVWHQFSGDVTLADNPFDNLDRIDLHAAAYDPVTATWGAPARITENGVWDLEPRVVAHLGGGFTVAWVEDADGRFETTSDRTIRAASTADGATFTPMGAAVEAAHVVGAPALAAAPGLGAVVAWVEDADASTSTLDDRVVRVAAGAAGAAFSPAVDVAGPGNFRGAAVAPSSAGGAVVAWHEAGVGEQAIAATTLASSAAGALEPQSPVRVVEGGNVTVGLPTLHARAATPPVLTYLTYSDAGDARLAGAALGVDLAAAHEPRVLLEGDLLDVSAALAGADRLLAAGVAARGDGAYDVLLTERAVAADLAVAAVATDPANPAPGSAVTLVATVENRGDGTSAPAAVEFALDGTVAGVAAVGALAPGESADAQVAWFIPPVNGSREVSARIVGLADPNPENDAGELLTTIPDLAIVSAEPTVGSFGARVLATVENVGAQASTPTTVSVLAGASVVASVPLAALEPGQAAAAEVSIPAGALPAGTHTLTVEVAQAPDFDAADNVASVTVGLDADLAVETIDVAGVYEGASAVTAVVRNVGSLRTPDSTVAIEVNGVAVASAALPALNPLAEAVVDLRFDAPAGTVRLDVVADPAGVVLADESRGNNRAGATVEVVSAPSGEPAVTVAGLRYTPAGVEVTVMNRGSGPLAYAPIALYDGYPQDRPEFGLKYVTRIPNLLTEAAVADVPAGGSATVLVGTADAKLTRIGSAESLFVRIDPFGELDLNDPANDIAGRPLVAAVSGTHPDPETAYASRDASVTFTVAPTVTATGYSVVVDQSPGTVPGTTVTHTTNAITLAGLADGTHFVHVRAELSSGAWTVTDHLPIRVLATDVVAPTSRLSVAGAHVDSDATYLADDVLLTIAARDVAAAGSGVSGVAAIRYGIDGAWADYSAPFTLPPGVHTVEWYAVDAAGNVEATSARAFVSEADVHAPVTVITGGAVGENGGVYVTPTGKLTLAAEDPSDYVGRFGSDVAGTQYRVDGGAWTTYTGPFPLGGADGSRVVEFRSTDGVGNVEVAQAVTVTVDGSPPTAMVTSHENGAPVVGETVFEVLAEDAGAGMARVELWREGELVATKEGPNGIFALVADTTFWTFGNNALEFVSVDRLGYESRTPLEVYAVTTHVAVWKDPYENLDRYLPREVRDNLPVN